MQRIEVPGAASLGRSFTNEPPSMVPVIVPRIGNAGVREHSRGVRLLAAAHAHCHPPDDGASGHRQRRVARVHRLHNPSPSGSAWSTTTPSASSAATNPGVLLATLSRRAACGRSSTSAGRIDQRAEVVPCVGAPTYVVGVNATSHMPTDIAVLGADFYACSPYKFCGPHTGAVIADPALLEDLRPAMKSPTHLCHPQHLGATNGMSASCRIAQCFAVRINARAEGVR